LLERYWIEDQGWFALIADDGRGMLGMQGTVQVPLEAVEPIAGVDYSVLKPRWWVWRQTGYVPRDHPPSI
jgi:hypothetical protein